MKTSKTIDETLSIPVVKKGVKLYHYTSAAGLKEICLEGFWATKRSFLNDSMEFQVATDVFCEVFDNCMKTYAIYCLCLNQKAGLISMHSL